MSERERVAARNLWLQAELVRLVRGLRGAGIESVVLKGIPLARRLWGGIDRRWMADNDLLVRRSDAVRARDALVALGYRPPRFLRLESQLDGMHAYGLSRELGDDGRIGVDLHWTIAPPRLVDVPEALLWEHVEPFDLAGERLQVFDPPLTILHLAWHFAVDYFTSEKTLADLVRAWATWGPGIDRAALLALSDRARLRAALAYAFACVEREGHGPPVPRIDSPLARLALAIVPPQARSARRPGEAYRRLIVRALVSDPRRWPRYLRHAFFPPIDEMAEILGRPPTAGLYWRYATRPLQPLARWRAQPRG